MFVFSDLHGNYSTWCKIKKFIDGKPAICLGDVIDRGKNGYKILREIMEMKNIILIKGNHEQLFYEAAQDYDYDDDDYIMTDSIYLYFLNGGQKTFNDWIKDGANKKVTSMISKLPTKYSYKNYDFCHAGCLKSDWEANDESKLIWSRDHFSEKWYDDRTLIFGHTPVSHLLEQAKELDEQGYEGYRTIFDKKVADNEFCFGDEKVYLPLCFNNKIALDIGSRKTGIPFIFDCDKEKLIGLFGEDI